MARTVLDVDRDLLKEAKRILAQPSLTATINEALRRVVAEEAHRQLLEHFAEMDDEQRQDLAAARHTAW
jgi:Arc/MetJ family transcription regulator